MLLRFSPVIFAILFAAIDASALKLTLSTRLINRRYLTVNFTPSASAVGCTYRLFGSGSRANVDGSKVRGRLITRASGDTGATQLTAAGLKTVLKNARTRKLRKLPLFLRATVQCGATLTKSNIERETVNISTEGVARSMSSWLSLLSTRFAPGTTRIVQAFSDVSFDAPVDFKNAGDGSKRVFVVEQGGLIYSVSSAAGVSTKTLYLDLSSIIDRSGAERGLLGLAFHPNFKENGYFYVHYTSNPSGNIVVARYRQDPGNSSIADPATGLVLLDFAHPLGNHNGGALAFGSDGFLYIGVGDGGGAGDQDGNAQNLGVLLGKILRIDVDNPADSNNYGIPSTNPFKNNILGIRQEIYAYGVRNPWRFSIDSGNRLWVGDVGQGTREEVNIILPGRNYGWNRMEGNLCYPIGSGCNTAGLSAPLYSYPHSNGGESITGGYVYAGSNNPQLTGLYIFADFTSGQIDALLYNNNPSVRKIALFDTEHYISSFGVDEDKELYFLSYAEGKIYTFSH